MGRRPGYRLRGRFRAVVLNLGCISNHLGSFTKLRPELQTLTGLGCGLSPETLQSFPGNLYAQLRLAMRVLGALSSATHLTLRLGDKNLQLALAACWQGCFEATRNLTATSRPDLALHGVPAGMGLHLDGHAHLELSPILWLDPNFSL